jgi:hypothetical protein
VNDLENRLKSSDKEKMGLFMELERERAKFAQSQSTLFQDAEHLKDKISKL